MIVTLGWGFGFECPGEFNPTFVHILVTLIFALSVQSHLLFTSHGYLRIMK